MHKFWSLAVNSAEKRSDLYILDEIAEHQSWWGDEVTPKAFKRELDRAEGSLYVWLDSPGGDAFAGSMIHDMLREYSASGRGRVIAMVTLAASAASIIAMAADEIRISLLGTIMIHEPWSRPTGKSSVLRAVADVLDSVRDGQVETYMRRTGQSREKILELLNGSDGNGTYMNARTAIALGFADSIMHEEAAPDALMQSMRSMTEVKIASCLEREEERLAAMRAGAAVIDGSRLNAHGISADAIAPRALNLRTAVEALNSGKHGDIVDAITCGIRAALDRWGTLQAEAAAPEGDDISLQALLSAIEDTNESESEVEENDD